MNFNGYRYIGMRLNKDMYSRLGTLVIPASTLLTQIEIQMLRELNIVLRDEDVEESSILGIVNSSIKEIKDAFQRIRHCNELPYDKVREKIVPIIVNFSQYTNLKNIMNYFELHDEDTYRHSIGVALLSRKIGQAKGLSEQELQELTIASFLHDVGKAKIPLDILNKPGKLTPEEFNQMKCHPEYGYELIKNTPGTSHRQALVAL